MKKGDKIVLLSGGNKSPLSGFNDNEIYEVLNPSFSLPNNNNKTFVKLKNPRSAIGFANEYQIKSLNNLLNKNLKGKIQLFKE